MVSEEAITTESDDEFAIDNASKHSGGKTFEALRWTLNRAASEFGIARQTVATKLRQSGAEPGKDDKFSTLAIVGALYGDAEQEKTRYQKERADAAALENAKTRGELVEKQRVMHFLVGVGENIRAKIVSSSMPEDEIDQLLEDLHALFDARTVTQQICPELH